MVYSKEISYLCRSAAPVHLTFVINHISLDNFSDTTFINQIKFMEIVYITLGALLGLLIGWISAKAKLVANANTERAESLQKLTDLDREYVAFKSTAKFQISVQQLTIEEKTKIVENLNVNLGEKNNEIIDLNHLLSTANANLKSAVSAAIGKNQEHDALKEEFKIVKGQLEGCQHVLATKSSESKSWYERFELQFKETETLQEKLKVAKEANEKYLQELATAKANNNALTDKLEQEKKQIEELRTKFNIEFENIANRILDTKTEKFTELNKSNLKDILDPLGLNIHEFKKKVEEVYNQESKERFSLSEKVKELAQLNQVISEEARNLTKALKGESKIQGNWGEMILESILEKSGLVKGREYFMEYQLTDQNGNPLKSASEDKKMRPDVVIKYPDNRSVIIDSKVSLNAFIRLTEAVDMEVQKKELSAHINAIKSHITSLSAKGYDDYDHALDFVMLFVPSEAAYTAAMQGDPNLWNFAYDKRILLLSPTNLITSLKLIVDLWKREYQNKNAQKIAKAGADLYDKFVGFALNLKKVGDHLDSAQAKYSESYKQLCTGRGNLVKQASDLKDLGLTTRKELPSDLEYDVAFEEEPSEAFSNS